MVTLSKETLKYLQHTGSCNLHWAPYLGVFKSTFIVPDAVGWILSVILETISKDKVQTPTTLHNGRILFKPPRTDVKLQSVILGDTKNYMKFTDLANASTESSFYYCAYGLSKLVMRHFKCGKSCPTLNI